MEDIPDGKTGVMARCAVVMTVACTSLMQLPAQVGEVGSARNRFLILDSRIVEKVENARLAVGAVQKYKGNPLFGEDKPWEKRFDNLYGNVIFDREEQTYKCWYSPFIRDHSAKWMTQKERDSKRYGPPGGREMAICYATSKDGIHWQKPELGLVEYKGSKANNIVWRGPHGAGVMKDHRDSDPARRYKMIFQGLSTSHSADGINWSKPRKVAGIRVPGDTHNNVFWDPHSEKYVGITRTRGRLGRQVYRIESSDFESWESSGVVMEGLEKSLQTYAMPVFIHGGVYLGLVAIHAQRPVDRVWTELAWSTDSKQWHRIAPGKALIPCSDKVLDYDYGCVYACAYPVFLENEIRLYYGGSDYHHFGWRNGSLCLAILRPDGFAGYEQKSKDQPAVITTTAIAYAGQQIRITADVEDGGSIKVSLVDDQGRVVVTAGVVSITVTDGRLKWSKKIGSDKIRLRFEVNRAKLYSFSYPE